MRKFKNLLFVPILLILLVPLFLLSACNNNNDPGGQFCSVSILGQPPQGVTQTSLLNGHSVAKGENVEFSITLNDTYTIGDLKVLGNGVELVSFESQSINGGEVYYYRIENIQEDVVITFTGYPKRASYSIATSWVNNTDSTQSGDKNVEDFAVDVEIMSVSEGSTANVKYEFDSISDFKDYLDSDTFYSSGYFGDVISFTIYCKDDYESFVDDWIICNDEAVISESSRESEIIDGVEVGYLKAKYNVCITKNTTIYFYEKEIVRSAEIKDSTCELSGITEKDVNLPKIVLKDENGDRIKRYADLKTASTINAYIENINDVWRPLFNNANLEYQLEVFEDRYVFKNGEYVSDQGSFVFENVGIPYNRCTKAYYTLYLNNVKELILNESNYKKMSITANNIKKYNIFEGNYIYIEGEGQYCYVQCKNKMLVDAYNKYTKIQIELSNDDGETETITLQLPSNSKEQSIIGGYTISRYGLENNYKKYIISYDGTGVFYNNIKLTALEN